MKKKNFFIFLRNFLALWAGLILVSFICLQVEKMAEAFVLNAQNAFKQVTDWRLVLITMLGAGVIALVIGVLKKVRKE